MTIADVPAVPVTGFQPSLANGHAAPREQTGRERRESERVIAYWEQKLAELGGNATVTALDLSQIQSPEWSHRFVIAVDPVVENSALLLYGSDFGRLLELPEKRSPHVPMVRQLPKRYSDLFIRGCGDADRDRVPVRIEGEVAREDGHRELYRAAFIPVGVKENSITHLAFGAFNSRIAAPALAA